MSQKLAAGLWSKLKPLLDKSYFLWGPLSGQRCWHLRKETLMHSLNLPSNHWNCEEGRWPDLCVQGSGSLWLHKYFPVLLFVLNLLC